MKEVLERAGFVYMGICHVCGGNADLYKKDGVQAKLMHRKMKFELIINGKKIVGKSNELENALAVYIPKETA